MTILSVAAAPSSSNNSSPNIAIAGIAAGAAVVGVLGVAFAVAYSRRSPRQTLTRSVLHDDAPEVKQNPIRVLERQRSMSFPVEPDTMTRMNFAIPTINNTAQKNPFAAKTMSPKFLPAILRSGDYPPPPPSDLDV